jgi:hypothetical protein
LTVFRDQKVLFCTQKVLLNDTFCAKPPHLLATKAMTSRHTVGLAQQGFHGPRLVRDTCQRSGALQSLTGMRLRESHDLRPGRPSREAHSTLRHTARRPPSPDDWGRWRTPERTPEVDGVPCLGRVQQARALGIGHTRCRGTSPVIRHEGSPRPRLTTAGREAQACPVG